MRETDDHSQDEEKESGLRSVLSGWALWAAIVLGFAVWTGVRSLLPEESRVASGIEEMRLDLPAPAAGPSTDDPWADDNVMTRPERPIEP